MRSLLLIAALVAAMPAIAQPRLPFTEDFEASRAQLAERGWLLPPNAALTDESYEGDQALRIQVTEARNKYAQIFLPVETGSFYRARVRMRCEGVERHHDNSQHRGAVIFLQWADHDRDHVSGGSFPDGLFGSHDWSLREVSWTRQIPPKVGYLHVLLGIEGTGVAWFDELAVERIEPGWPGPEIVAPADGATVTTQRPELAWRDLSPGGLSYRVQVSATPRFDDPLTASPSTLTWRPDRWLEPGTWYWRLQPVQGTGITLPPAATHSFEVAEGAERWPVEIRPAWGWSEQTRPELIAELIPPRANVEVAASVNGEPASVRPEAGRMLISPPGELPRGVHDVRIELRADGREVVREAVFCNRLPGARVSFRDDRVMLIDGEPHFPLGAYRDPSDRLDTFDGLEEAGFNLTHSYHFEEGDAKPVAEARSYLQAAHEHGLHVFLGLSRKRIDARDYAWAERFAGELMDEPGLLTWYLLDEPAARGVPVEVMKRFRESVARVDPFHPASIVICHANAFGDYASAMDVCWADIYPLPAGSVTAVERRLQTAREQIGPEMPLWAVLQGHDIRYWRDYEAAVEEFGPVSIPTPAQTRCMAWLSLAAGADGLVWYWGPSGSTYHMRRDAPEVWQGIVDTVRELRELEPWLTARRSEADDFAAPEPFRTWSRAAGGTRLLAVVNSADQPATLDLDLTRFRIQEIARRDGGPVALEGRHLQAEFGPLEVRLYEWAE
ncbi:MAG: hypothetical protein ACP5KN_10130 [Armatimonadota bacterium]